MLLPRLIIAASWALFLTVWILRAFGNKQTIEEQPRGAMRLHLWPLLIGALLIALPERRRGPLAAIVHPLLPHAPALAWAGALVALLGVGLALWARQALGRNWSGTITVKRDHALVTHGPYALIRHPIYTALLLLLLALLLIIGTTSALAGFSLGLLSCLVKLRQEEALMMRVFPDAYPAYAARTWRLVPGLF